MHFRDLPFGKSNLGEEIQAYISEDKASKYTYLMAGVHGDEVEGIYVLKNLFEWLKKNEKIKIPLLIIPLLNVDGYRAHSRVNAKGVDLNRNLPSKHWTSEAREEKYYPGTAPLSEPENKFLVKLFEKYPPKFILSFHSWKPMLNYNGNCKEIAEFLSKYNGYPPVGVIEDYPTPGSLGEYGPEVLKSPVLTWECPLISETKGLKEIWEESRLSLENLFNSTLLS
jgi:protein MpaA